MLLQNDLCEGVSEFHIGQVNFFVLEEGTTKIFVLVLLIELD